MRDLMPSMYRLALRLMPLLLMALVAGSTFWLVQVNSPREENAGRQAKKHEPDYYMIRFSATDLAEDGSTKIRFTGDKMIHFEDDQTYEVTRPAMRAYQVQRPPVTGHADLGRMNAEATVIDLFGNAHIVRAQGADPSKDPQM